MESMQRAPYPTLWTRFQVARLCLGAFMKYWTRLASNHNRTVDCSLFPSIVQQHRDRCDLRCVYIRVVLRMVALNMRKEIFQ